MFATSYRLQATGYRGFTLIEALVLLFIFAVVSMTFLETYATGTRLIIESKNRLGATALANQKMEIIRSIDYDIIGTTTGIPAGDILEYETISVNTVKYRVHTFVQYADDIFDGQLGGNPTDTIPNDYKRVKISVSWGALGTDQTVSLFTNIAPDGVETSAGGGVLSINILDSAGMGMSGASVHIVNSAAGVDVTTQTDATGNITLPGTPAGTQNYALTVSKGGHYGVMTYPPYPTSPYNPIDEHASVAAGVLNQKSMVMDQYADITVRSKDPFGTDVPNIAFNMTGGKILGTDPVTLASIYEYNQNLSTSASGVKDIADQSYGQYTLAESDARYQLHKLSPEGATKDIFDALAGQATAVDMVLLDTQIGSVKVVVINDADGSPIAGATVRLTNTSLGYDATQLSDQYGFAYFPTALPGLVAGTYNLAVSATGFQSDTDTANVNNALITETIDLIPN
ncbi:MAG: carboxypeptidase regulatory-like domain-containing protein [Patescibacteria group bacterium]